jgi:hypothetical protein
MDKFKNKIIKLVLSLSLPDLVARKGVLLVFADSVPFIAVGVEVEDLLELGWAPGENLDLVLAFTVSQPPSSSLFCVKVFKLSTDLGVLRPLTVSAHDLLELDELIDEVEPKGGGTPLGIVLAA